MHPDPQWAAAVHAAVTVGNRVAQVRPSRALDGPERLIAQHEADMMAHRGLHEALTTAYPGCPVVSEEDLRHDERRPSAYWLIDPIDGTASWSAGFPGFVCQLALVVDDTVRFGALHAPVLERTWTCASGDGAYLNGVRMGDRHPRVADEDLVVVDNYPEPRGVARDLMDWLGTDHYLECGSIGLKAALVASGEADVFVKDVVVRDWDIAPALALLAEVSGDLRRGDGQPYELTGAYEKAEGVLVTRDAALGDRVGEWLGRRLAR